MLNICGTNRITINGGVCKRRDVLSGDDITSQHTAIRIGKRNLNNWQDRHLLPHGVAGVAQRNHGVDGTARHSKTTGLGHQK